MSSAQFSFYCYLVGSLWPWGIEFLIVRGFQVNLGMCKIPGPNS